MDLSLEVGSMNTVLELLFSNFTPFCRSDVDSIPEIEDKRDLQRLIYQARKVRKQLLSNLFLDLVDFQSYEVLQKKKI